LPFSYVVCADEKVAHKQTDHLLHEQSSGEGQPFQRGHLLGG